SLLSTALRPPTSPLFPYTTLFRSDVLPPRDHGELRDRLDPRRPPPLEPGGHRPPREHGRRPQRRGQHRPAHGGRPRHRRGHGRVDRKSTRLNSSHVSISYAVFCLK